jgi:hypothetical protein
MVEKKTMYAKSGPLRLNANLVQNEKRKKKVCLIDARHILIHHQFDQNLSKRTPNISLFFFFLSLLFAAQIHIHTHIEKWLEILTQHSISNTHCSHSPFDLDVIAIFSVAKRFLLALAIDWHLDTMNGFAALGVFASSASA